MERYKIIHHLGAGSFGNVVVALEKQSNMKVAMKFIGKVGKRDKDIQSLKKEWDTHKNLRHPNVILMLDSFETVDSIVVVTELAHGDLYKVAPQYSRWQASAVQKIACDLVSALHCLHSQRILHRDLKPQNILIGFDGKAKLCDFGFAKAIEMNSFMLTSMKGTPLYMAPEIIMEQPYDQTADLWSLGCILYELFVGQPPFHTDSLFILRKMMIEANIVWHDCIDKADNALSFLQGLLEKDPKKRLTWPNLRIHPYVYGKLLIDRSVADFTLTKALTSSQELVKETERQKLQKELEQCSRVYQKAMKKYAQAQKKLKRWNSDMVLHGRGRHLPLDLATNNGAQMNQPVFLDVPQQHEKVLQEMFQYLNLQQGFNAKDKMPKEQQTMKKPDKENVKCPSSDDATTSSSDSDIESDDDTDEDDRKTVIHDKCCNNKSNGSSVEITAANTEFSDGGGVLFTLDTSGSTEFKIDSAEWLDCLTKTMKEVLEDPRSLCQKGILTMLLGPLKNTSAEPIVLEKIAVLLSLPFALEDEQLDHDLPGYITELQNLYLSTKVLPLLLFACKLIIVNRVSGLSLTFEKIVELLTEEDLSGIEKCFRLVTFLVHTDESFVTQFCDSVCVLKLAAVLQLFLKLDVVRPTLAADTVAVLCHLLRVFPNNGSIVEDVVLGGHESVVGVQEELWRLISHSNSLIQSKSIRLFTYLSISSVRVKREFVVRKKPFVWNVLKKASISSDNNLRETAKFCIQALSSKPGQNEMDTGKSQLNASATQYYETETTELNFKMNVTTVDAYFQPIQNNEEEPNQVEIFTGDAQNQEESDRNEVEEALHEECPPFFVEPRETETESTSANDASR